MSGTLLGGGVSVAGFTFGSLTLQLGSIVFTEASLEVPQEMGDLGGTQSLATHRFPGGVQTQQTFGAFPPKEIRWRGLFTGQMAASRRNAVDRLRVAGQEVQLSYGDKTWLGIVREFRVTVSHQWLMHYEVVYEPRIDLSASSPSLLGDIISALQTILGFISRIISLFNLLTASSSAFPTPPSLQAPTITLFQTVQSSISSTYGQLQQLPPSSAAAIYAAAQALIAAAAPLTADPSPEVSSPALDLSSYATSISALVSAPAAVSTVLHLTNPNFLTLSSQYYGTSDYWRTIALASGISPPDPMPTGQIVVVVPAQPST